MVQQTLIKSNPPAGTDRYPGMPDTDFADFLTETDKFIQSHPHILELIEDDLDAHARSKKARRIKDSDWEIKQSLQKEGRKGEIEIDPINEEEITLQQGRPRTSAYVVFIGIACSGYHENGPVSRSFQDLMYESRSIQCLLHRKREELPALKTFWELIDAVSNETRNEMLNAQCEEILDQDLDDFSMMILDSTHVKANTAWPTEAGIILKLIERIWRNGNQIEPFGYENFQPDWTETWIDKIKTDLFKINTADNRGTRKKHYKRVYHFAEGAHDHLDEERKKFEKKVRPAQIKPSRREKLNQLRDQIRQDLSDLKKVISYSKKRVLEGESTPAPEKVLSVGGDEDASYITKGGREAVIGYRPQIGRSEKGFIGAFHVPEGNANDAPLLLPMLREWQEVTGVVPMTASTDDGYASEPAVEKAQDMGVELTSISGAKGKKILGRDTYYREEYWDARDKRSAVESTISVMKGVYGFGRASRRGKEAVKGELMEDVIAQNFLRMVQVRQEKRQREEKESDAA